MLSLFFFYSEPKNKPGSNQYYRSWIWNLVVIVAVQAPESELPVSAVSPGVEHSIHIPHEAVRGTAGDSLDPDIRGGQFQRVGLISKADIDLAEAETRLSFETERKKLFITVNQRKVIVRRYLSVGEMALEWERGKIGRRK